MIALDTNVLIRIITNDDAAQTQKAVGILNQEKVFISKTVLLEMEWVLRGAYQLNKETILNALRNLLGLTQATVEDEFCVKQAISYYEQGFDFADALHLASSIHAEIKGFFTFDKRFRAAISKQKPKIRINF